MRRLPVVVALGLILAACGAEDPEAEPLATTTTTTRPPPTTTTTTDPTAPACGDAFPVFPAELPGNIGNVAGTPGPGPTSQPAADRQLVAHWEGDEYATFELRWPAEPADIQFEQSEVDAVYPVTFPQLVGGRAVVYMEVAPERSDPCRLLAIEAYGPRTEPLMDSIFIMLGSLLPAAELDDYLAEVADRITPADDPEDRPPGRCATPVPATVDEWGQVQQAQVADLVNAFLADRVAGLRATDCLTESALAAYPTLSIGYYSPPLCLFECDDGSALVGFESEVEYSSSGLLEFTNSDGSVRHMRERFDVVGVPIESGGLRAMIVEVWAEPESYVSEALARWVISGFLDALAAEEWGVAWGYLLDEGVGEEVWRRWEDPWEVDPSQALPEFCATALCDSRYEILDTVRTDPYGRSLNVRFLSRDGPIDKAIAAGMFEGHLSISSLPPEGRDGESADSISERLFGEEAHGELAVVRYDVVELVAADGSSDFSTFWPSRSLHSSAMVGDWVVYDTGWEDVYAVQLGANSRDLVSSGEDMHAAGAAHLGDSTYALIANASGLFAHDLESGSRVELLDRTDDEFVDSASVSGDLMVVSATAGDLVWFEIYDISTDGGTLQADLSRTLTPRGAAGHAHPSPDGQRLAYIVEEQLHHPTMVAVSDLAGTELARWTVPTGRVIGPITYDGRWIIGELWESLSGPDSSGERLVIDTETSAVHVVDSYDRFLFR